ncbi:MAG TPA: hypothetical protein VGL53_24590 [Bryobacteraceae bacterium]
MLKHLSFLLILAVTSRAADWVLIRCVDGTRVEGVTQSRSFSFERDGRKSDMKLAALLSIHNGMPASEFEAGRITQGITAIQGTDRAARDLAVDELTAIGVPLITPLLNTYKDSDHHEPQPLYRLFERIMPSYADGPDRTLSLVRVKSGEAFRASVSDWTIDVKTSAGGKITLPWSKIRSLAVRQKSVERSMHAHSLRHSTQIEYLDTGVAVSESSKVNIATRGFVRLSWDTDTWATDADGLKVPGSPAYKSNLWDGQPFGALVGRIGARGPVFFVGKKATLGGKGAGRLELAVNDNPHWQNNVGTYYVTMSASDAYDLGDAQ